MDFILLNNKKIYKNDIFLVRQLSSRTHNFYITKAKYLYYDDVSKIFCLEIENEKKLYDKNGLLRITKFVNINREPPRNYYNESDDDIMIIGWIWYVVLMFISIIFYSRIACWVVISFIFFNYRAKRIRRLSK